MVRRFLSPQFILMLLLQPSLSFGQSSSQASLPTPTAGLLRAPAVSLSGKADSNSPVLWTLDEGELEMRVLTSVDGQPSMSEGSRFWSLVAPALVQFTSHPGHGVWMEAVIEDDQGAWYGFYHNEIPADLCGRPDRVIPRIGAARSFDKGVTWEDLGIVLEAPLDSHVCESGNGYFLGGVGDLSALLDPDGTHVYLFFSQYGRDASAQGIAVARLLWATRDSPVGRTEVWNDGAWLPATPLVSETTGDVLGWTHASGTALFPTSKPWHDGDSANDAFWGASVHWNTFLEQYVMLFNRAADEQWTQEGIYVAFAARLDDPQGWSAPQRLLAGGGWYPQVIGIEQGAGTDKYAGQRARLFVGGASVFVIEFKRPGS